MYQGKVLALLYFKNAVLLSVIVCVVLSFFDVAFQAFQDVVMLFNTLTYSMKVIGLVGLAAVPAILTKLEFDMMDQFVPSKIKGVGIDKE